MYYTFEAYKHQRENRDFGRKFHKLCEAIALSGMSFDQYWREHAIPVLRNSVVCESPDEVLSMMCEAGSNWNPLNWAGNAYNAMFGKSGGGSPIPNAPDGSVVRNPEQNAAQFANDADAAQDPRIAKARQALEGTVNNIKNKFMAAMKDFHKAISDDAKKTGDAKSWKMAELFYKQMMQTVTPQADSFLKNLKINFTKPGETPAWQQDFQKQAGAMQAGQQAQRTDAMRADLIKKHAARTGIPEKYVANMMKAGVKPQDMQKLWQQQMANGLDGGSGAAPAELQPQPQPDAALTTAGAAQPPAQKPIKPYMQGFINNQKKEHAKRSRKGDVDLMESLIRGAGKRPSPANPMG